MSRPNKSGVSFFPHDVDSSSRKTLFTIESKFGNDGYCFWFKLLEILGQQDGLFYDLNDNSNQLFLESKCNVSRVSVTEMLDTLSQLNAIDPELWAVKIVWSQNFTDRLASVFSKRRVSVPEKPDKSSFCDRNHTSTGVSGEKGTCPRAKEKERKVKNSKEQYIGVSDTEINYFDEFWKMYPKKVGKEDSKKSFSKLKVDDELFLAITDGLEKWKSSDSWAKDGGQYIPNPATWLNGKRWEDEIPIVHKKLSLAEEFLRS